MQKLMVYSESGGVTKTTTTIGLAVAAANAGKTVTVIDLDPRAASTKWVGAQPKGEGLHVGAILGNDDVEGWAEDLAVPTGWHPNLRIIPSARSVSTMEGLRTDHAELRLASSLAGLQSDLVVIDCPNRQGGPLILSALNASDSVVYAATATEDGLDGVLGAQNSVRKFQSSRATMGAPNNLHEAGVIVGAIADTVQSRIERETLEEFDTITGNDGKPLLLRPFVPSRVIVKEMRVTHEWFGNYKKAQKVVDAYAALAEQVIR